MKSRCFPGRYPAHGMQGGGQFPPDESWGKGAYAEGRALGDRWIRYGRQGRGWRPYHPRCPMQSHSTERTWQAPSAAVEEIFRYGQRNARAIGRKCRISHHVALQRLHEGDTGIFAAATTIRPALVLGLRLQCNAKPFRPQSDRPLHRTAPEQSRCANNSPLRRAGERGKADHRPAGRRRIENAFGLLRIAWLGFHHHADAFSLNSVIQSRLEVSLLIAA